MTLTQLAEIVGADRAADVVGEITHVSSFADAMPQAIVFAQDEVALASAVATSAGAILAPLGAAVPDPRVLRVRDPKYMFALAARHLRTTSGQQDEGKFIHASAIVHPSAKIGGHTRIDAGAVIEARARIGERCVIGSRVTVCEGVVLGDRVVVQAGAVLGSLGFGYVRDRETGEHLLFPQQGRLVIEDDVEIGANTTIDRGALGETRIGCGTKIDNLVQIGHNCVLGRNVIVAAQVGMSGSCVIGDGAVLAGQAGLGDHVTIGPGVILGGSAGVFSGKRLEGRGQVFMGVPAEPLMEYLKSIARARREK